MLNPEGINALRFFEGRGNRVWGARTMSSDPEWKYVNVRRLFIYLEHSIDKGTQWAVFEPNNARLWANIRQHGRGLPARAVARRRAAGRQARGGLLRALRPHHHDPERPRQRPLICLIGVAPVKPAEFVIFRIGQWTADAKAG